MVKSWAGLNAGPSWLCSSKYQSSGVFCQLDLPHQVMRDGTPQNTGRSHQLVLFHQALGNRLVQDWDV